MKVRWIETACRRFAVAATFAAVAATPVAFAQADKFPVRPVKIVVPSAPGGSIDITARAVAMKLADAWGGNAFVENRPGAAMATGASLVAHAPSDGYTLLVAHNGAMSINPLVMRNLSYDPERDFVAVSILTDIPQVVLVNPTVQAKTLQELIGIARTKPGSLNHASGGLGSMLPSELLKSLAKIDYVEIPFPGAAPATAATMGGTTQLMITDVASARGAMDSGRLRPLAVTSTARSKLFPEVPTVAEAGVPGYETSVWIGLFAPARTPPEIINKIRAEVQKALKTPEVKSRLEPLGIEPGSGDGNELSAAMKAETQKWRALVQERNLKFN